MRTVFPVKYYKDEGFVDDATGQLMHLRFGETESAFDYMRATREYIDRHGKPLVFYSDKHGIFRVNHPNGALTGTTQFGVGARMAKALLSGPVHSDMR